MARARAPRPSQPKKGPREFIDVSDAPPLRDASPAWSGPTRKSHRSQAATGRAEPVDGTPPPDRPREWPPPASSVRRPTLVAAPETRARRGTLARSDRPRKGPSARPGRTDPTDLPLRSARITLRATPRIPRIRGRWPPSPIPAGRATPALRRSEWRCPRPPPRAKNELRAAALRRGAEFGAKGTAAWRAAPGRVPRVPNLPPRRDRVAARGRGASTVRPPPQSDKDRGRPGSGLGDQTRAFSRGAGCGVSVRFISCLPRSIVVITFPTTDSSWHRTSYAYFSAPLRI